MKKWKFFFIAIPIIGVLVTLYYVQLFSTKSSISPVYFSRVDGTEGNRTKYNDAYSKVLFNTIISQADEILKLPLLEHDLSGKRMLLVSRSAVKRVNYLSFAFHHTKNKKYINRLEALILAVADFDDWNPSHFLDTAEMAFALGTALSLNRDHLSSKAVDAIYEAIVSKAIIPSFSPLHVNVFLSSNNWNIVSNSSLYIAASAVSDRYPKLFNLVVKRLEHTLPIALENYEPDGAYVEGPMYWNYASICLVFLIDALRQELPQLESLVGQGFYRSSDYILEVTSPSGRFFNYSDSAVKPVFSPALLWFYKEKGLEDFLQRDLVASKENWNFRASSITGRFLPFAFHWYLSGISRGKYTYPKVWVGQGDNPIGVLRGKSEVDDSDVYLAVKAGRSNLPHGNIDSGSFILEIDDTRWSLDIESQDYQSMEDSFKKSGKSPWSMSQDSVRWEMLSKNNFGHSTISIDNSLHKVAQYAKLSVSDNLENGIQVDMNDVLGPRVSKAIREFSISPEGSVLINDSIAFNSPYKLISWRMVTDAEILIDGKSAILKKGKKSISLDIISPSKAIFSSRNLTPQDFLSKDKNKLKFLDIEISNENNNSNPVDITVAIKKIRNEVEIDG